MLEGPLPASPSIATLDFICNKKDVMLSTPIGQAFHKILRGHYITTLSQHWLDENSSNLRSLRLLQKYQLQRFQSMLGCDACMLIRITRPGCPIGQRSSARTPVARGGGRYSKSAGGASM